MAYGSVSIDTIQTSTQDIDVDALVDRLAELERNTGPTSFARLSPDVNGLYTVIEYYRPDGTLVRRSTLSGGTSPQYTTRTVQFFAENGTTVVVTKTFNLTYSNNELISEIEVVPPTP